MDLIIIELLSVVSLLLALLLLFSRAVAMGEALLLLLWCLLFFSAYHRLRNRWGLLHLMAPLAFLPLLFRSFEEGLPFYLLLLLPVFFYTHTSLGQAVHERITRRFRWSYSVLFLVTLLGMGFPAFREELSTSLPFVALHLFSTILLTSALRHQSAGIDRRKSARRTYGFLSLAVLLSAMGGITPVRNAIFQGLQTAYDGVSNLLIRLAFLFVWTVGTVVFRIAALIFHKVEFEGGPMEYYGDVAFGTEGSEALILREQHPLVNFLLTLALFSILAFVIFKVLLSAGRRRVEGMDYKEEREFLHRRRPRSRRSHRREKLPTALRGQIRYHYRRYLEHLQQSAIPLKPSDTSLDVARKDALHPDQAKEIRALYVKARYSDLPVDASDVEALKEWTAPS